MSKQISQLVDGDIEHKQMHILLESLSTGKQDAGSWGNYHLIGNIIRGEVSVTDRDLSASIADALENEPTVLSPSALNNAYPVPYPGKTWLPGGVDEGAVKGSAQRSANDYWRPVGMLAVAASLALVAVITLTPSLDSNRDAGDTVAQDGGAAWTTQLASSTTEQQKFAQEFDEMLSEHGEFAASSGLNGLVAYAKLVSNQRLEQ
jgi:negative regulator of sigma E activity